MNKEVIGNEFGSIMFIVPHQDDEILMGAGILYEAVRHGIPTTVVMVTNGDYGSSDFSIGRSRLRETLASLEILGLSENQVEFLGYADTGMPKEESFLYQLYQEKDGSRIKKSWCSAETYGLEEKEEFHKKKYGIHAPYDRNHVEEDLKQVILQYRPNHIFTTSEYDFHGDHSGLYLFVRDILKQIKTEGGPAITLYSGIVHSLAGDGNWPLRDDEVVPYTCPMDFEETSLLRWNDRSRFEVPDCMKEKDKSKNLKYQALSKHVTALKPDAVDFLYSFIKNEELFWKIEEKREFIYPIEPWCVTENSFSVDTNYRNETTFSLSNGYLGTRGTLEEGYDFSIEEGLEGNFINGFYEQEDIRYGEWNYGFPTTSQSLMNLPNCKTIKLFLGEEELDLRKGKVSDYHRTLHMDEGVLTRGFSWTSEKGKTVRIETSRFVSFAEKNLMEMRYKVTPMNFEGELLLVSTLNADVENHTKKTNPLVDYGPFGRHLEAKKLSAAADFLYYEGMTKNSHLTMACGSCHRIDGGRVIKMENPVSEDGLFGEIRIKVAAAKGETVILEKQIAYTSSLDMKDCDMESFIKELLFAAKERRYDTDETKQKEIVREMWKKSDVVIHGDEAMQQGIRFNLFHILQSAARDGKTGMGAKGLSGEGYEGHYFWDTEMYIIPILVYINPELAKALLRYRYKTLDEARDRARVLGHEKGALYPWRTINGKEASTYYPLGTAQYHIDADIAYAFKLYLDVTGDMEFLKEAAAEVLVETARVWADVGCFADSRDGRYCICSVTGPDEYNAIVDNNFYTNLMARENIRDAGWALDTLKTLDLEAYQKLTKRIDFQEKERLVWEKIIEKMYFPYEEKRKIYPLDDGFLIRKPWDESKIPPEKRHLLYENYHPLFIFRQQMSKQADAILGMYLHSNLFTAEELKRNYDFYQEVTLHHSSLSTCIFGILACQIGYEEESYDYFSQSARMDLDDYHNNFYAGIHAANMAGTWQAIANGFAGLRMNRGYLEFWPTLPKAWSGYEFRLNYRGSLLEMQVDRQKIRVVLLEGKEASFQLCGKWKRLEKEGNYAEEKR